MPATPSWLPKRAKRDAGVAPRHLLVDDGQQEAGRVEEALGGEIKRVQADLGGLLDDGPRGLFPFVPFVGGGPNDVLGEVVHPFLDLQSGPR